jgi:hypothetical protein
MTSSEAPVLEVPLSGPTRLQEVAVRLQASGRYEEAWKAAFGSSAMTTKKLAQAVTAYVNTVRSTVAPFDRFRAGHPDAIDDSAKRGFELFRSRAGCAECHVVEGKGGWPVFTDFKFHNTGLSWKGATFVPLFPSTPVPGGTPPAFPQGADDGRMTRSGKAEDLRTFKTPTLREIDSRGPYMHDGSLATLEEVVRYYAKGCTPDPRLSSEIRAFEASDQDVADLVSFLESLTGDTRPGLAPSAWTQRAKTTRVRVLGPYGPMSGIEVTVLPAGDLLPGAGPDRSSIQRRTTDKDGWIEYAPPLTTHSRIVLPEGMENETPEFVPDTCKETVVRTPTVGRAVVVLELPAQAMPPKSLEATHDIQNLPGPVQIQVLNRTVQVRPVGPRTPLRLLQVVAAGDVRLASYEGWARSDRAPNVRVTIPLADGTTKELSAVLNPATHAALPAAAAR